ncbi:MAG: lipoprotein insertase outer membrane protein LolB [Xanthomonadales bacterium]|nr:lipoprotein insertase outer membrane protein LolB [Xanthomonadales bacterium]
MAIKRRQPQGIDRPAALTVWRAATLALLVLMLTSCAWNTQPDAEDGTWVAERERIFEEVGQWRVHGRLGISNGKDGGSAGFVIHDNSDGQLRLNLSATGGRWRLLAGPDGAELEGSKVPLRRAPEPEPLVQEALGWYLPVTLMRDWLRGIPAPAGAALSFSENGALAALDHADWHIEYQRFREVDGVWLPQKVVARSGPYKVSVVVLGWRLGEDDKA